MALYKYNYTPPGFTETIVILVEAATLGAADALAAAKIPAGFGGTLSTGVLYSAAVLSNVDNTSDANKPVSTAQGAADSAVQAAAASDATTKANAALASANSHSDALVVGLWDDRGNFDASGGAYPSTGGSGTAGAILKGDIYLISVAGTLPTGQVVEIGDSVRAKIDTPGNTQANWAIIQNNIGYVAENSANKTATVVGNEASTTLYLNIKGYYDYLIGMVWLTAQIWGTWIVALTAKTTPVDADSIVISDSAATNAAKKVSFTNLKAFLFGSPTFTGTPAAPTASPGTNTTQLATTAFVLAAVDASDEEVHLDGTLLTGVKRSDSFNLTTTGGIASTFLTSDGATKSGGNTFLYTTIYAAGGNCTALLTDANAGGCFGANYNGTTGLFSWKFMSSNTVTLGGEGLEDTGNGAAVLCYVKGIK